MSVITPKLPTSSRSPLAPNETPPTPPPRPFNRPSAPEPNEARDNELINYYFDGNWTTKDIADHFKLAISVVAAWFQRSDIAAIIDFVAAANERRARDIARESLPGTVDILHRISRVRKDDKVACAASSALIRISRGPSAAAIHKKTNKARPADGTCDTTAAARARRAGETPPRGMHDARELYTPHDITNPSPGRDANPSHAPSDTPAGLPNADHPVPPHSAHRAIDPPSEFKRAGTIVSSHTPPRARPADLLARAGAAPSDPTLASVCCNSSRGGSSTPKRCKANA